MKVVRQGGYLVDMQPTSNIVVACCCSLCYLLGVVGVDGIVVVRTVLFMLRLLL